MEDVFITGVKERYPSELLQNRVMHEGNVIALIYKDILLLDEISLKSENFLTQDGRFYFEVANNIRKKGFNVIDEVTILSECNELIVNGYEKRGGWQQLQDMIDIVNDKNSDTYLDTLYRENILLRLHDNGFNLMNKLTIEGKDVVPLNLFRKMTSEEVLEWYEYRLSLFTTGNSSKVLEEGDLYISDDFIDQLEEGLLSGVPFDVCGENIDGEPLYCLPFISNQVGGFLDGTLNMLGGFSSSGKSTLITTVLMGLVYRGRKAIIITNEQRSAVFKIQFLTWILAKYFKYYKVTKKKLKNKNELTADDKEMIRKSQKLWNERFVSKFKFIQIEDSDISLAKKKIRQYVLNEGYDTFLYDTFKSELSDINDGNNWLQLIRDSRELDKVCKKYDIIGLANVQLAQSYAGTLFLDASLLSQSKQVKEILETLLLIRPTYQEELDKDNKKFYCRPFKRKLINNKWIEEEYEADRSAVYRTLFFEKNRNGESSNDNGVALLLKFNGANGTFTESAFCYPKHGRIQG